MNGGYDEGYQQCACFWGEGPGSLISTLESNKINFQGMKVLDAGCGEGKNAIHLAKKGANVLAIDVSEKAIYNAKALDTLPTCIQWHVADISTYDLLQEEFDIIVAYGLLHCLKNEEQISQQVVKFQGATKKGGYIILCAFNCRSQDLAAAHPGFKPTCIDHVKYVNMFKGWDLIFSTDTDLRETHPHNNIEHIHSMSRIIARKT